MKTDERLRELICKIENCLECYEDFENYHKEDRIRIRRWYNRDPWFFPSYEKVKGFFGTGKVFIVCERPSTGTFPDNTVIKFYEFIKEYWLENAHITDLIKCREKNSRSAKKFNKDAEKCFKYLLEELKILKPKTIVAVDKTYMDF